MRVEDHPTPDHNIARKYPTLAGAYLCGCVLFQTLTGLDVRKSVYTPLGLSPEMRIKMQKFAYETVVEFEGYTPADTPESQSTKPPYRPMADTRTSSPWNWVIAAVLMAGGIAFYFLAYQHKKRATTVGRDYGWNPVAGEEASSMELSEVPAGRDPNLGRV